MSAPATACPRSSCCSSAATNSSKGTAFYCLALALLLLIYAGARFLKQSQLGLVLAGMRQNEERLAFFGYRVQLFKALVFSLAGMVAGLGGALYSYHQGFIGPGNMGPGLSTTAVLYCLFGGSGTLIGPIIGTATLEVLSYVLSDIDAIKQFWPVILGLVLLIVVMFQPKGLLGLLVSDRERIGSYGRRRRRRVRAPWRCLRSAVSARRFGTLQALDGVDIDVAGRHVPRADRSQRLGQEHAPEVRSPAPISPTAAPSCSTAATSRAPRPTSAPAPASASSSRSPPCCPSCRSTTTSCWRLQSRESLTRLLLSSSRRALRRAR